MEKSIYHYPAKCNWPNHFRLIFNKWKNAEKLHMVALYHVLLFPFVENTDPNILSYRSTLAAQK